MADDANDVSAEITLADFDGEDNTEATSSVEEDKKPEVKEEATEEEVQADDTATETEEAKPEETDTDKPEEETPTDEETETTKPTKAEERKNQLNTEIRDLVAQRNKLKAEVSEATKEVYQPATEAELVDEGLSATEAKVEAMRQTLEVRDYNERVAESQLTLSSESLRVLNDFPLFNSESDQYDQELAAEAAEWVDQNLIRDENVPEIGPDGKPTGKGLIVGSNGSIYNYYKTLARAANLSATKGQLKGQAATQEMLANADSPGSAAPPRKKADPLTSLWEGEL